MDYSLGLIKEATSEELLERFPQWKERTAKDRVTTKSIAVILKRAPFSEEGKYLL